MGYGSPGGASTFLELGDTPATYTGQALKLVKVNVGETALSLDLLLSFTDWYSGGAPTSHPWEFEAPRPYLSGSNLFSQVIKNEIDQFIVYVALGYDMQYFFKYNITTKQWHRLADTPAPLYHSHLAVSPDGKKLAGVGTNDDVLYIYDIEGNSWTTSPTAPQIDAQDVSILPMLWFDNDTIWCQVRKSPKVKMYKYVPSTTTWTDFVNEISPSRNQGIGMSMNSAGTILYVGDIGAAMENFLRYTIATDNYDVTGTIGAGKDPMYSYDRNARLWVHTTAGGAFEYWNCDTDVLVSGLFESNSQETVAGRYGVLFDGDKVIVGWVRSGAEPTYMSYSGTGYWKLGQQVLTDYNLVVFKKPTDGFPIVAIDKANGYTAPVYVFGLLVLPAGTWEFFYPKDGDYTQLVISGSEMK